MIVDNADDGEIFFPPTMFQSTYVTERRCALYQYLPDCRHGSILFTTRDHITGGQLTGNRNLFKVDKMTTDDAIDLLHKVFEGPDVPPQSEMTHLAASLNNLPLAIVQAASYIQRPDMDIGKYLKMLDSDPLSLLSKPFTAVGRLAEVPHALATTWLVTFKHLRHHHYQAARFFSCMSFLDSRAIPRSILPGIKDDIDSNEAISILLSFSFITKRMSDQESGSLNPEDPLAESYFDIHPLVHLITREFIKAEGKVDIHASQALEKISQVYPEGWLDWPRLRWHSALEPHATAILRWTPLLIDRASKWNRLVLEQRRANLLLCKSLYPEAMACLSNGVMLAEELFGPDHSETFLARFNLMHASYGMTNVWDLLEDCRKTLQRSWRLLGMKHATTMMGVAVMGDLLRKAGYLTLGCRLTMIVWYLERHASRVDWLHIMHLQNTLASDYSFVGNYAEAERLLQDILDRRGKEIDGDHCELMTTLHNMWFIKIGIRKYGESERIAEELVACSQRTLDDDFSKNVVGLHDLAMSWIALERYDEAAQLLKDILDTKLKKVGPQDAHHYHVRTSLAIAMLMRNDVSGAIQLQNEALSRVPEMFESLRSTYQTRIDLWRTIELHADAREDFEKWNQPGKRSDQSKWSSRLTFLPPVPPSPQGEQAISIGRIMVLIEDMSRGRPRSWLTSAAFGYFGPQWKQRRRWHRFHVISPSCLEEEKEVSKSHPLIALECDSWRKTGRVGILKLKVGSGDTL